MLEFLYSKKFLVILGVVCIFIGISFYVYNSYIAPKINQTIYLIKNLLNRVVNVMMTHIKSCFYLFSTLVGVRIQKVIKDVWPELKSEYNGKNINHYKINFLDYDGDKNEKELQDFENTYNKKIDGYPSIFIVKDDQSN